MSIQLNPRAIVLCAVLTLATLVTAQTATPALPPTPEASYPEQAYLSPTHYVNWYFGFTFPLPPETHLHPNSEPAARDGSVPLLDLAGPPPADALVLITAIPAVGGKDDNAKAFLREALNQELYRGVEEIRGLTKASYSGHQFYLFETRRGIEQHILLATNAGDYILRIVLAAHDEKTVKRLQNAFQQVEFFGPMEAREHLDADAKPYDGPAISSYRLAMLEKDPPAKHIDAGNVSGDFYENSLLGFSYRIPQGWSIEPESAVQPAIERHRTREDFGRPRMGRVEKTLLDNCGRTLFSSWAKRPSPDGTLSYDDFGEVTISALSTACFPTMKFPENVEDPEAFKSFIAQYSLTHPIVNDMRNAKVFTQDGITFLFLHGTVAFQIPDDTLSRRLSLGMAITQRRGYILTWFFASPHDEELRALTNERASFDRGTNVTVANAPQPGGGVATDNGTSSAPTLSTRTPTSATAAGGGQDSAATGSSAPQGDPAAQSAANAQSGSASDTSADAKTSDDATGPAQPPPSLLRPGETMDSQQGKGATTKKK